MIKNKRILGAVLLALISTIGFVGCKEKNGVSDGNQVIAQKESGEQKYAIVEKEAIETGKELEYKAELTRIEYLSNGTNIEGILAKPKDINGKLPVLIFNRGKERLYGEANNIETLLEMASKNYVVLATKYRDREKDQRFDVINTQIANDVLNLIKSAESLSYADTDNIIMLGYSLGGKMSYHALRGTENVKAAVIIGGETDFIEGYNELEYAKKERVKEIMGGDPESQEERYKECSPYYWADEINTPLLILHGEKDECVNKNEAEKMAKKLDELGKEHELVIYPEDRHGLIYNWEDAKDRIFEWFDKYLEK